ncbi:MAG: hypothetical protein QOJ79_3004 [Actinomycetota bacterium]|nr:hypothetical protein [Actinomycetota bacterium]
MPREPLQVRVDGGEVVRREVDGVLAAGGEGRTAPVVGVPPVEKQIAGEGRRGDGDEQCRGEQRTAGPDPGLLAQSASTCETRQCEPTFVIVIRTRLRSTFGAAWRLLVVTWFT